MKDFLFNFFLYAQNYLLLNLSLRLSQPTFLSKLVNTVLLASNIEYFFFTVFEEISSPDENTPTFIFLNTFIFFKPREDN